MMIALFLLACSFPSSQQTVPDEAVRDRTVRTIPDQTIPDQIVRKTLEIHQVCLEADSKLLDANNWIPELREAAAHKSEVVRNEDGTLVPKIFLNPEITLGTIDLSRPNGEVSYSYSLTLSRETPCGWLTMVDGDALVIDRVVEHVDDATIEIDGTTYSLRSVSDRFNGYIGQAAIP